MLEKINRKHLHGYLLYIILDGVKIDIDGWFTLYNNRKEYYQWIGMSGGM